MRLGKYELGKTLGEGNFGKVKYARNVESGQSYAVKIYEKNRIVELNITDEIKREIGTLKLLKHPNVVRLHERDPYIEGHRKRLRDDHDRKYPERSARRRHRHRTPLSDFRHKRVNGDNDKDRAAAAVLEFVDGNIE